MTPDQLKALIASDPEAKRLAESGAADLCAARCRQIAPKVTQAYRVKELDVLALYADPRDAETVMQQIERAAASNTAPLVKRVVKWLQPGADGVDLGNAQVRTLLTVPVNQGGAGLTAQQARPLLAAAEVEPQITGADVSTAWPFGV
jgi:hypothetical protein